MAMAFYQVLIVALCFSLMGACKKPEPQPTPLPVDSQSVYIVCEGAMGNGNGEVYAYNKKSGTVSTDVFTAANGQQPGDVLQSLMACGTHYLLSVTNADKIEVVEKQTWKRARTLSLNKPRNLYLTTRQEILCGSLFDNKLSVWQYPDFNLKKEVRFPYKNVEATVQAGTKIFVACWDDACPSLYVLRGADFSKQDSVQLPGKAPHSMVVDKNGRLWVLAGNAPNMVTATLTQIDTGTLSVLKSITFPSGFNALKLRINATADRLYFLGVDFNASNSYNGVFAFDIEDNALPVAPIIKAAAYQYFWALAIDPYNHNIYVGDPKGFIQRGDVFIYNPQHVLQKQIPVGIGPGAFIIAP